MTLHKFHIWGKSGFENMGQMVLANQIAGFLNQLHTCNKIMK